MGGPLLQLAWQDYQTTVDPAVCELLGASDEDDLYLSLYGCGEELVLTVAWPSGSQWEGLGDAAVFQVFFERLMEGLTAGGVGETMAR
ncbi:MAG: hypothetical protein RLZZ515_2562 [Cyanobacteriota bacterium]|jgi:hypothetical protein